MTIKLFSNLCHVEPEGDGCAKTICKVLGESFGRGRVVMGGVVKWLDVQQDGPVARGEAVFITGQLSCSQLGMKDGADRSRI